ncbi:MAG: amidohydrolase family protein, partial [Acidobacteria bacterium]|nr:amidohydrolase family protein [Acidobacteriota bacterium]
MSRTTILCLALTVSLGCAPPQESEPAAGAPAALREVPAEGVVLTNARVLDGNGGVIDQGSVVVRDGRIVSVTQGAADVPAGALVIDVQGRTVMPSYIDAHRHIIQGDPDQWLADRAEASMQEFIAAGFTTLVSAGDAEGQILELRRRTAEGDLQGPRIIAAGRAPLAGPA